MGKRLTEAQQSARLAILRDFVRSGGTDRWSHLHSHGHNYMQVQACANRGDIARDSSYEWRITDKGLSALSRSTPTTGGHDER